MNMDALNAGWCFLLAPEHSYPFNRTQSDVAKAVADKYTDWLLRVTPAAIIRKSKLGREFRQEMARLLLQLSTSFDVDVTSQDLSTALKFRKPIQITRREDLAQCTQRLLHRTPWNRLMVATVAGEWLAAELQSGASETKSRICNIDIISNLDMLTEKISPDHGCIAPSRLFHYCQMVASIVKLLEVLKTWSDVTVHWYAFRNLEHHMTISLQESKSGGRPLGAIYFRRLGKNTSISPVFLREADDLRSLYQYFTHRLKTSSTWLTASSDRGLLFKAQRDGDSFLVEVPPFVCPAATHLGTTLAQLGFRVTAGWKVA